MTKSDYSNMVNWLTTDATLIGYVGDSSNIKVSYPKTEDSYPCITFSQVAGTDVGMMGRDNSSYGSKDSTCTIAFRFDAYSRNSLLDCIEILERVGQILLSHNFEKLSDVDGYVEDLEAYNKMTIWRKQYIHTV